MTLSNGSKNAPKRRNITEMGLFVSCQDRTQRNGILESHHTLFPGTRGQRKNSIFKMFILTLWRRVSVCSILASFSVKSNYIFTNAMKNKRTFFFWDVFFREWIVLENQQKILKNQVFLVLRVHSNDAMVYVLWYIVGSINGHKRAKF